MARVAIVHFSGPPAIGGIESSMVAQAEALLGDWHAVRVVVGRGEDIPGTETVRLPELHPDDRVVRDGRAALPSSLPAPEHPLVTHLTDRLCQALDGCDHIWVHNAFTVYLNPFLTVALYALSQRLPARWCAWCADLTPTSGFQSPLSPRDAERSRAAPPHVRYVVPSEARRQELERYFHTCPPIRVIPPPLRVEDWLGMDESCRRIVEGLSLPEAEVVVLVPAKLLPHKGLDRAVRVADRLRSLEPRTLVLLSAAASPHEPALSRQVRATLEHEVRRRRLGKTVRLLSDPSGAPIARRGLRDLMLLSDVIFVPSEEEGFGMPLLEAAVFRVPVVCSDLPAFRDSGLAPVARVPLHLEDRAVATIIRDVALTPANRARRIALRSWTTFRQQLRDLLGTADPC